MKLSIYKGCLIMTHLNFTDKNSKFPPKQRFVQKQVIELGCYFHRNFIRAELTIYP